MSKSTLVLVLRLRKNYMLVFPRLIQIAKEELYKAKDSKKMHDMMLWMDIHCLISPYIMFIQRCDNDKCCGEFRSPVENGVRDLIMQQQPTPRVDTTHTNRTNQFLRRDEALLLVGDNEKALIDLSDLP